MNKKKLGPVVVAIAIVTGLLVKKYYFNQFYYVGTIEATRIDLSSRLASNILSYTFEEGDEIKKDDVLVKLDCADIEILREYTSKNFERSQQLLKVGGLPKEAYDLALKNKQEADLKWSWCHIAAPISGTILTQYMDDKEWVVPGTKLVSLANLNTVWAFIYVEQPMLSQLQLGMTVEGFLPEMMEKKFKGKIIKISNEAEFTPKNVQTREERSRLVFGIKIQFENQEKILKPGMSIEVDLPKKRG